jgi:ribokinase
LTFNKSINSLSMKSKIIVVGSSNTDLIVRANRLPTPGETVLGHDLDTAAGGKGANQAVAAARLGSDVTFIARLGDDPFGQAAFGNFLREGLDTRFIIQEEGTTSGAALIMVDPTGQNLIAVAPGANRRLASADVQAAQSVFEQARVVLLQLETPLETVQTAAELACSVGALVILNPAPAQPLPESLLQRVGILTPNETEARLLTSTETPEAAASVLLGRGVKTVIVTLGEAGVLIATPSAMAHQTGFEVTALDTTAAGDAFNGGLASALARELPLQAAVRFAQAVAALSVTRSGAQASLPFTAEVKAFLQIH